MPKSLFLNYLRHNEINEYLDSLAASHPELVTVSECAKKTNTSPDNPIQIKTRKAKTFSKAAGEPRKRLKPNNANNKSTILIDGGIHGREWMSVATAVYCIHELIEHFDKNKSMLEKLDFVIVPIVNVDGYEYSHTNFPFWRKTRRPQSNNCDWIGTDCNRNFDHQWKEFSGQICKNTYPGERPFSEPETILLKSLMHSVMPSCKFYLSLHSHAKSFMYPWGYTKKPPTDWRKLHRLALIGQNAIKMKTGNVYRCGSVATLTHRIAAGGSPDYAYGVVKIPYVMTMELGGGCFHPPSSEIFRIAQESWIGISAMCSFIAQL